MPLLRRTLNNVNSKVNQAGHLMIKVDDLVDILKAIALDARDGAKLTAIPLQGFSKFMSRFVLSVATFLIALLVQKFKEVLPLLKSEPAELNLKWMEGQQIPIGISIDLEYDALPPHDSSVTFQGGDYHEQKFGGGLGEQFGPDGPYYGRTRVRMINGQEYIWDGYVMVYDAPQE